jgi:hypothetical protein
MIEFARSAEVIYEGKTQSYQIENVHNYTKDILQAFLKFTI